MSDDDHPGDGDGDVPAADVAPPGPPGTQELVLRVAHHAAHADAWSLVLQALAIPHRVARAAGDFVVLAAPSEAERAGEALDAYDREQREAAKAAAPVKDVARPWGAALLATAMAAFYAVTGGRDVAAPSHWFAAGAADAGRIVAGEWWRAVTALTLHADPAHVTGNGIATLIFVAPLCRWVGNGVAVAAVLASGVGGNLLTAALYGGGHRSVGASTATFGALGLLAGLQIYRRMNDGSALGRGRRVATIVAAAMGIFAMLGVGERADVIAHAAGLLSGLLSGLILGVLLGLVLRRPVTRGLQAGLLAAAAATVVACWRLALRAGA